MSWLDLVIAAAIAVAVFLGYVLGFSRGRRHGYNAARAAARKTLADLDRASKIRDTELLELLRRLDQIERPYSAIRGTLRATSAGGPASNPMSRRAVRRPHRGKP